MEHFDYIIAGGGCSGRSLAVRILPFLKAANKRLLFVDKDPETVNDRTWCFWEEESDIFEPVVYRKWERLSFYSRFFKQELNIQPYQYKMIRASDFYDYTDKLLLESPHLKILKGTVEELHTTDEEAQVIVDGKDFRTDYVFSSIPQPYQKRPERYQYMLQHFLGWVIETENNVFDDKCATLMDFSTSQLHGTSFIYVLPLAPNLALIEFTVFSEQELQNEEYVEALRKYILEHLNCGKYIIKEEEYGVIPMSDHPVPRRDKRIIYLGTAGGFTKGSTGYTFRFIQKHTKAIVKQLESEQNAVVGTIFSRRFCIYDAVLLHLLQSKRVSGEEIFATMFKKNKTKQILKFLDNETSLVEEIQIFSTLNKKEFSRAFVERTLKIIRTY